MAPYSIGVVVPTINSEATLEWTLLSLLNQERCEVEVIVADSGSADGTLDICHRHNVPTIFVPRGNMYRAINAGMQCLQTSWLTYLNSDDLVYGDAYRRLIHLGEESKSDVVYGDCVFMDSVGRPVNRQRSARLCMLRGLFQAGVMGFAQPAAVFRREVYVDLAGFDEKYRLVADFEFYARAFATFRRFARLEGIPAAAFRIHGAQLSSARDEVGQEMGRLMHSRPYTRNWIGLLALSAWRLENIPYYWRKYRTICIKRDMPHA